MYDHNDPTNTMNAADDAAEDALEATPLSDFDLAANTSVSLSAVAADDAGDVLSLPTVFDVDDTALASIADNGDGSAVLTRADASSAGSVVVTATVTNPDGSTVTGTISITLASQAVAPSNATSVNITPGDVTA
jgi:hypothetical protein